MQVNFGESDLKDLLSKVKIFDNAIGEYQFFTVNEHFQYFIKVSNGSLIVSIDDLIANQNQSLTAENLQKMAANFKNNDEQSTKKAPKPEPKIQQETPKVTRVYVAPPKTGMTGLRVFSISLGTIILVGFAIMFFVQQNRPNASGNDYYTEELYQNDRAAEQPKTEQQLKQELYNKEKTNPKKYISGQFSNRSNLLGERVFEGELRNSATLCGFKDVRIRITAKAETGYELDSREYVITEFLIPNGKVPIKLKTEAWDRDTKEFAYSIISADTY